MEKRTNPCLNNDKTNKTGILLLPTPLPSGELRGKIAYLFFSKSYKKKTPTLHRHSRAMGK